MCEPNCPSPPFPKADSKQSVSRCHWSWLADTHLDAPLPTFHQLRGLFARINLEVIEGASWTESWVTVPDPYCRWDEGGLVREDNVVAGLRPGEAEFLLTLGPSLLRGFSRDGRAERGLGGGAPRSPWLAVLPAQNGCGKLSVCRNHPRWVPVGPPLGGGRGFKDPLRGAPIRGLPPREGDRSESVLPFGGRVGGGFAGG